MLLSVLSILSIFISAVIIDLIGLKYPSIGIHAGYFYGGYRFPSLLAALFIFLLFCCYDTKTHIWINRLASLTFGIYLIHDNPYIREILWNRVFNIGAIKESNILIPYSIFSTIIVFVICGAIEALRIFAVEKRYSKSVERISNIMDSIIRQIIDRIASNSKNEYTEE